MQVCGSKGISAIVIGVALLGTGCGPRDTQPLKPTQTERKRHPHRDLATPERNWNFRTPRHGVQLDNGIRAVLVADWSSGLVEVGVRYRVGAIHDPPGKSGLAHLVEHLLFEQRPPATEQPRLGTRLRDLALYHNAFTRPDSTHYLALTAKDRFDRLMALEAERLATTCGQIDEAVFLREREVVRQEMRERGAGIGAQTLPLLLRAAYPPGHPYRRSGFEDYERQLGNITRADVCEFIERHYVTENALLVVTGSVSRPEFRAALEKHFGPLSRGKRSPAPQLPTFAMTGSRVTHKLDVEDATMYVMWPVAPRYSDDGLLAELIVSRVASDVSRRNDETSFAYSVQATSLGGPRAPVAVLSMELESPEHADKALAAVSESFAEVRDDWDDGWAMGMRLIGYAQLLQAIEPLRMRSDFYGDYVQFDASLRLLTGDMERMAGLSAERLSEVARSLPDMARIATVVIEPDARAPPRHRGAPLDYQPESHLDDAWRVQVDARASGEPLRLPALHSTLDKLRVFELPNGLRVMLLRTYFSPMVHLDLIVGSGHAQETIPGLAQLAGSLFKPPGQDEQKAAAGAEDPSTPEAGKKRGEPQNEDDGEDDESRSPYERASGWLGGPAARTSVTVTDDQSIFRVDTLNPIYDHAIHGLAQWVQSGEYRADDIAETRERLSRSWSRERARRALQVAQLTYGAMFGGDHPYSRIGVPEPETVAEIDQAALQGFRERHYVASNATLIVTGQFVPETAEAQIRAAFGSWKPGTPAAAITETPTARNRPLYLSATDKPDAASVSVHIGYTTPVSVDGRYGARQVLAEMLAERVSSIRSILAASYGIRAAFIAKSGPGYYSVRGSVDAARAGTALKGLRELIQSLRTGENFDADFVRARQRVAARVLSLLSNRDAMAEQLAFLARYRLPKDYLPRLGRQIANMTPDDVKALIADELPAEREVILCIGDRAKVAAAYRTAGLEARVIE